MQQRFAEGLATHLTSGVDVQSSTPFHYDDLLAGLPADPTMAALLEPLVLPADAYQIPAHLHHFIPHQEDHQPRQHSAVQPLQADYQHAPDVAADAQLENQPLSRAAHLQACGEAAQQHQYRNAAPSLAEYAYADNCNQLCWEQPQQQPDSTPLSCLPANMAAYQASQAEDSSRHDMIRQAAGPALHSSPARGKCGAETSSTRPPLALPAARPTGVEVQSVTAPVCQAAKHIEVHPARLPVSAAHAVCIQAGDVGAASVTTQTSGPQRLDPAAPHAIGQALTNGSSEKDVEGQQRKAHVKVGLQSEQQGRPVDVVEKAVLDSLYATIFPDRQATQEPTSKFSCGKVLVML